MNQKQITLLAAMIVAANVATFAASVALMRFITLFGVVNQGNGAIALCLCMTIVTIALTVCGAFRLFPGMTWASAPVAAAMVQAFAVFVWFALRVAVWLLESVGLVELHGVGRSVFPDFVAYFAGFTFVTVAPGVFGSLLFDPRVRRTVPAGGAPNPGKVLASALTFLLLIAGLVKAGSGDDFFLLIIGGATGLIASGVGILLSLSEERALLVGVWLGAFGSVLCCGAVTGWLLLGGSVPQWPF